MPARKTNVLQSLIQHLAGNWLSLVTVAASLSALTISYLDHRYPRVDYKKIEQMIRSKMVNKNVTIVERTTSPDGTVRISETRDLSLINTHSATSTLTSSLVVPISSESKWLGLSVSVDPFSKTLQGGIEIRPFNFLELGAESDLQSIKARATFYP